MTIWMRAGFGLVPRRRRPQVMNHRLRYYRNVSALIGSRTDRLSPAASSLRRTPIHPGRGGSSPQVAGNEFRTARLPADKAKENRTGPSCMALAFAGRRVRAPVPQKSAQKAEFPFPWPGHALGRRATASAPLCAAQNASRHVKVERSCYAPMEKQIPSSKKQVPNTRKDSKLQRPNPKRRGGVVCLFCFAVWNLPLGIWDFSTRLEAKNEET